MRSRPRSILVCLLLLLSALVVESGCATTPSPDDRIAREDLADTVRSAAGIYHCAIETTEGTPRFTLLSIWHHAPTRGPAPAVGAEMLPRTKKSLPDPTVSSVIVFIFDPPVLLPNGHMMPNRTVFVFDRQVPSFRRSLTDTEKSVRALLRSP